MCDETRIVASMRVSLLDAEPVLGFFGRVGEIAERAPGMTGYEIQSELFQAYEEMADAIRRGDE